MISMYTDFHYGNYFRINRVRELWGNRENEIGTGSKNLNTDRNILNYLQTLGIELAWCVLIAA